MEPGAFLIDLDETLVTKGTHPLPGAAAFLARLRGKGLPFRICSNTTRRSRAAICYHLAEGEFDIEPEDLVIPASLARRHIVESGKPRAMLLVPPISLEDFHGVVEDDVNPQWVVLGDLGEGFTHARLSQAFRRDPRRGRFHRPAQEPLVVSRRGGRGRARHRRVRRGAALCHRDRPVVVGKPEAPFYRIAIDELGLPAHQVLMIGDSMENDVVGAAAAGCKTCFVRRAGQAPPISRTRASLPI